MMKISKNHSSSLTLTPYFLQQEPPIIKGK